MIISPVQKIEYENNIRRHVLLKGGRLEEDWKYVNSGTKMKVTCDKGHEWLALWSHLKQGSWCPECAGQVTHEEDVLKFIEEKGGKVDPGWKYKNEKTPFWVTCDKGHRWNAIWSSLKHKGTWCPYCIGHTVDKNWVKKFIEDKGGILDRNWNYVGYNKKFWLTCENGHKWETTWNVIQQGHWCPECIRKVILQRNSDNTEDIVREYISGKGGKLDSEWKYVNNHEKFWIECDHGHRWQAIWANVRKGHWCPYCMETIVVEKDVRAYIENKDGHLPENWKFVKSKQNFRIQCGQGHYFQACWDKIRLGQWCPYCYGNDQPSDSEVKGLIAAKKGKLDSDWKYVNYFSRFWVTCSKGHRWQTYWNMLRRGIWCPKCKETVSENKFRGTIERILLSPFPKQKPEWLRSPLTGRLLELDGYNQDLKMAFEYQGPYHYQMGDTSQKRRDEIKVQKCTENNVTLIRIPYWVPMSDWESEITNQISNKG